MAIWYRPACLGFRPMRLAVQVANCAPSVIRSSQHPVHFVHMSEAFARLPSVDPKEATRAVLVLLYFLCPLRYTLHWLRQEVRAFCLLKLQISICRVFLRGCSGPGKDAPDVESCG